MVIVLNRPYILVLGLQNVKTCKKSWPVNLTEVVSKVFSNLSVIAHLVVPLGWGSCLPGQFSCYWWKVNPDILFQKLYLWPYN